MNSPTLVLGGPGCGKTTKLLDIVRQHMADGVAPSDIAFVSFTRAAANEAAERAAKDFKLDEDDLPWFRTIHSLCYSRLGIERDEVMSIKDWQEFSAVVGEHISGRFESADPMVNTSTREVGDLLVRICDYAATCLMTIDEAWHALNEPVDLWRLRRFHAALTSYKADTGRLDFTDMLLMYLRDGEPVPAKVVVIDEGQDLTASQWAVARRAFANAETVYVGGDDDQAIYHWAGADVNQFLGLSQQPIVLGHSHRLPRTIHALAKTLSARISRRYAHPFTPSDREGTITWHQYPESVPLDHAGSWLLLARNNYQLRHLEAHVRAMGIPYMRYGTPVVDPQHVSAMYCWEHLRAGKTTTMTAKEVRILFKALGLTVPQLKELRHYTPAMLGLEYMIEQPWHKVMEGIPPATQDFYLACLRRGEKLNRPPRIRLSTIHGVKGAESDNVAVMTDLSKRTMAGYQQSPDHEHRVFYVATTRARHNLHLIMPQSDMAYPLVG